MLSNFRSGLRICRPCKTVSARFLIRPNFEILNPTISRAFSYDVAPLMGELSAEKPSSRTRKSRLNVADVLEQPKSAETPKPSTAAGDIVLPHWVKSPIDLVIFKAENVDDLWNVAAKYRLSGVQAVTLLANLAKFGATESGVNFKEISSSAKKDLFNTVLQSLLSECGTLAVGNSSLALRSLLFLGVPGNHELMVRLRKKISKDFFLLSPPTLISFAVHHAKYEEPTSKLEKPLQATIEENLFGRMNDFTDPNDVLSLLSLVKQSETGRYRAVEAKLLEMIPSFSGEQLLRLLNVLATKKIRSLPLLKAIATAYAHCEDDLPIKKLAGFLSDLTVLHYPNLKMITVLFKDIEAKLQSVTKPAVIVTIFSSLAVLRLRSVELLKALCEWTRKNFDAFTAEELASVVVALARCNYAPSSEKDAKGRQSDLLKEISKKISVKNFENKHHLWLDAVWAMAILGRLTKEHAASVLDKSFYEGLVKDLSGNDFKQLVTQMKLRNVNTAARLEVSGYQGPFLDATSFQDIKKINVVHYKEEPVKLLTDALNNLAPRGKYMQTSVTTPEGYVLDALLRVSPSGKPIPINQWSNVAPNSRPVAVLVRHYNDTTQLSSSMIGLHAMAIRHLEALGYTVLEIPASEMEQRRQSLARVQFLKEKIDMAVQNLAPTHSHS